MKPVRVSLTVLLMTAIAGCADRAASTGGNRHPLVGHTSPTISGKLLDDSSFDLAQHQGQVIVLDFWATWCGPCTRSLPVLAKIAEEYKDRGVRFFAVNESEDPDTVRKFLEENRLDIRVVMDPDGKIGEDYKVEVLPQTVIIDKEGTIQVVHEGVPPNLKMEITGQLDDVLAGKKLASMTLPGALPERDRAVREVEVPEVVVK